MLPVNSTTMLILSLWATMWNKISFFSTKSKQIEHVQFVSTLSKKRNFVWYCCRNRQHCCENGNNVEATFDFVERTKFYDKLVRHFCRFLVTKSNVTSTKWNVASTFLLVWTGLNAKALCAGNTLNIRTRRGWWWLERLATFFSMNCSEDETKYSWLFCFSLIGHVLKFKPIRYRAFEVMGFTFVVTFNPKSLAPFSGDTASGVLGVQ